MPEIQEVQDLDPAGAAMLKPDSLPEPFMMMGQPQGDKLPSQPPAIEDLEEDDDDLDETLAERLWGLTEMFPESLRNVTSTVACTSWSTTRTLYSLGKSAMWVLASSAAILALPVMFETERAQMEEQQIQQQRQILLGPNAAVSGSGGAMGLSPGAMPQVVPPTSAQPR